MSVSGTASQSDSGPEDDTVASEPLGPHTGTQSRCEYKRSRRGGKTMVGRAAAAIGAGF